MTRLLAAVLLTTYALGSDAQSSSLDIDFPSNSFEQNLNRRDSKINYVYIDSTQTHDYSGNWDFDLDGKTDQVHFIGNGGAHLYYYLKIMLSSNKLSQDFSFLLLDFPLLEETSGLTSEGFLDSLDVPQFAVKDFDSDGQYEIFLSLDQSTFLVIKDDLARHNVDSQHILLKCKEGRIELSNFLE